jgi:hypothetical protein
LSAHDEHEPRLHALAERLNREPDDLVKHALGDLLANYEAKAFGGLLAPRPSPDTDRPLVHARRLSDPEATPLCSATDEPWHARGFDFLATTCHECQSLVLQTKAEPA